MNKTQRIKLAADFKKFLTAKNQELQETQPMKYYPTTAIGVITWLDENGCLRETPNTGNETLTSGMSNLLAYKLGLVGLNLIKYPPEKIGDEIDRGLVLRRLLEEQGFGIVRTTPDAGQEKKVGE